MKKKSSQKKSNARREEILSAAKLVFSTKGYHATRIQDISTSLNMAQGTFYLYFKNKEELFYLIIDNYITIFSDMFSLENPELTNDLASFKKQLVRIGEGIFKLFMNDKEMFRIIFIHSLGTNPSVEKKVFQLIDQVNLFTEQYLINGINKGFLKGSFDTKTTSKAINGMILTGIVDIMRGKSPAELKQRWISSISLLIIDGLI